MRWYLNSKNLKMKKYVWEKSGEPQIGKSGKGTRNVNVNLSKPTIEMKKQTTVEEKHVKGISLVAHYRKDSDSGCFWLPWTN